MKNTTISVIATKTEFDLVKSVNEDGRDFFATQPLQKSDGTWLMFCYSKKDERLEGEKPKEERKATSKQVWRLQKENVQVDYDNLSFNEANKLIEELMSK